MNNNHDTPIEITSRHEPVTDSQRDYASEKALKLLRFHNRISRIQVVIDDAHEGPSVEMIVHVDSRATLVAREHHEHFKGAIDLLVDKMERQLKKNNEKRKHHHRGAAPPLDGAVAPEAKGAGREDTYDDIVRRDLG
jgi:ribosomal subunit interface protein